MKTIAKTTLTNDKLTALIIELDEQIKKYNSISKVLHQEYLTNAQPIKEAYANNEITVQVHNKEIRKLIKKYKQDEQSNTQLNETQSKINNINNNIKEEANIFGKDYAKSNNAIGIRYTPNLKNNTLLIEAIVR